MESRSDKTILGKVADTSVYIQLTHEPWALDVDAFTIPTDLRGRLTGGLGTELSKRLAPDLWSHLKDLVAAAQKDHTGYSPESPLLVEMPEALIKTGFPSFAFIATAFNPEPDYAFAAGAAAAVAKKAAESRLKKIAISFLGSGGGGLNSEDTGVAMLDSILGSGPYEGLEEIILTTINPKSIQVLKSHIDNAAGAKPTHEARSDSEYTENFSDDPLKTAQTTRRILKKGDRGIAVKNLQETLVELGLGLTGNDISGAFDPKTETVLREFQQKEKLQADGIAGPETFEALHRVAKKRTQKPPFEYREFFIEKSLHNDQWAEIDLLDYGLYAKAITEIIREEDKKTRPPLTIAILAPWGQGKTTLMRYVERELNSDRPQGAVSIENGKNLTVNNIMSGSKFEPRLSKKISYPTVWFNPWKYQSSDQIYAGMAHAIITQSVSYLTPPAQEKFWFYLNLRRVDLNAIRSKIHKVIITNFISKLSVGTIIATLLLVSLPLIIGYLILNLTHIPGSEIYIKSLTGFASFLGLSGPSVTSYLKSRYKVLNEALKNEFQDVVDSPNYEKKMGLFHDVETDMERVFDLLVDAKEPAVIFIDDLDRCSPDKVVEVIEAMNLIINSAFSNKCYFIMGMDAQMVAASLDEKYQSLVGKFKEEENKYGSIGWYFLDKFIQMPIILPILSPDKKEQLLRDLFEREKAPPTDARRSGITQEDTEAVTEYLKDKKSEDSQQKLKARMKEKPEIKKEFIKQSIKEIKEDSPVIIEQLKKFAPYLGTSPRSIKRFANMFRYYNIYQELRSFEGHTYAKPNALAKWLVLSLRYPQLVRFLQWEREDKLINSKVPSEKAAVLDEMVNRFVKANGVRTNQKLLQSWKNDIQTLSLEGFDWLKEDDLIKLMISFNRKEGSLKKAIDCNVW